jgi:hypothetical protein
MGIIDAIYASSDHVYSGGLLAVHPNSAPLQTDHALTEIQVASTQTLCFPVPVLGRLVGTDITDARLILHLGTVQGPVIVSL